MIWDILLYLGLYFGVGIALCGARVYWNRKEGVTPEFFNWWQNYYKNWEGDAWIVREGVKSYTRTLAPAPQPHPPKRPLSCAWYYTTPILCTVWIVGLIMAASHFLPQLVANKLEEVLDGKPSGK